MTVPSKSFCSVCSRGAGVRTGGTGWAVGQFLILELPLPWREDPLESRSVPPGVRETLMSLWDDNSDVGLFGVAPDAKYSVPGKTRVMSADFAANPGGPAVRRDYLIPNEQVAATIDALARRHPVPSCVEIDETSYLDAMICTHGSHDACCATFGFPLYRKLRALSTAGSHLRVWRATHFGGHRFAPTMMTFPDGRSWGYLDEATGRAILERNTPVEPLAAAYRGWSGYTDAGLQLLEQEGFLRFGWSWLDFRQQGHISPVDEASGIRRAEIVAESPNGDRIELSGDILQEDSVTTIASCGGEEYSSPRFTVINIDLRVRTALPLAG